MKAVVFEKEGVFGIREVPKPDTLKDDQVLVKVEACSICGTDVHITATPPNYIATPGTILGHEFCGRIAAVGSNVHNVAVGDRVVANPNNYCGTCRYCRKNLPNLCEHVEALGIDYDGAFAEYCVINCKVAHRISEDVPAAVAACVEPLACAVNGLKKVNIRPGDSAVIIGAGPIGLMIAMLLDASGASRVYVLETSAYRIDFAKRLNPEWRVINPISENADEIIMQETGIGADFVFDVTGSQSVSAIQKVRKGGTVVLFGVNWKARAELTQAQITTKEISVLGTWLANATFEDAVRIVEEKAIDLEKLITDIMPLDDFDKGLAKLAKGQAVKVVIEIG